MKKKLALILCLSTFIFNAGCGQKGALYDPKQQEPYHQLNF